MHEWKDYTFKISKNKGVSSSEGCSLSTVYYVVHLPEARRILEDGCLRARLVYDESRLNRSRICVTWLSANTWNDGSIYGNVQLSFDWMDIVKNRQVYWVEAMTGYRPHAFRLLLTDRDMSHLRHVAPYNPNRDKGPLRKRKGRWYRKVGITSEFMVEADLSLDNCTEIKFIPHHHTICRKYGSSCPYLRDTNQKQPHVSSHLSWEMKSIL